MATYTSEYWKRSLASALTSTETASGALHYRLYESPLKGMDHEAVKVAKKAIDQAEDAIRKACLAASELELGFD